MRKGRNLTWGITAINTFLRLSQMFIRICPLIILILLGGCNDSSSPDNPASIIFEYDFNTRQNEWIAGFSDYPEGEESFYELTSDWRSLPEPLSGKGLYISGCNHSDDLFMFISKLRPWSLDELPIIKSTGRFSTEPPWYVIRKRGSVEGEGLRGLSFFQLSEHS